MQNESAQVVACLPRNVDDYLTRLKSGAPNTSPPLGTSAQVDDSPAVDLFLRTALQKKVPDDLRFLFRPAFL